MTMYFAKKLNKKGFTLAELLIVVAIIAVLVAIAVPIFTNSLEKARYSVHSSNGRALKSLAVSAMLGSDDFANQQLSSEDLWVAVGTYSFADEKMTLNFVTKLTTPTGQIAGMWCRNITATGTPMDSANKAALQGITGTTGESLSVNSGTYYKFIPNDTGYRNIGRIGTGSAVKMEYILIFGSTDISSLDIDLT